MGVDVDVVVVGAGVVGLAVARELALEGHGVLVLEAEGHIAEHQSSRNSEVIHAGLYYPPGSLKARLCIEGKRRLYAYAAEKGFAARTIGKLIVATSDGQRAALEAIRRNAAACGMHDLEALDGAAVRALEPELEAVAALLSPTSGIVDSHAYMLALIGDLEAHGGQIVFHAKVGGISRRGSAYEVSTAGPDAASLTCGAVVIAAGLFAPALAARVGGYPAAAIPKTYLAKGNYFSLSGRAPFRRLVYPVPEPGGLGVHLTLDLGGQARFGPDVQWIDEIDYAVDPARAEHFYGAIRRYWPGLRDGALTPSYAGIRAKTHPPGGSQDFRIDGPEVHGLPGLVALFGIESPGLTASLALAAMVGERLSAGTRA